VGVAAHVTFAPFSGLIPQISRGRRTLAMCAVITLGSVG